MPKRFSPDELHSDELLCNPSSTMNPAASSRTITRALESCSTGDGGRQSSDMCGKKKELIISQLMSREKHSGYF